MLLAILLTNAASAQTGFDAQVGEVTTVRHAADINGDGIADRINVILVDANGRSVGYENDVDADGITDYRVSIRRDRDGRPLTIVTDIDGDGIADGIERREYDDTGVRVRLDANGDGIF
ncbi:MAG: hypothetical protein AB8G17_04770 [Gammaproteobacteria bacterium]